MKGYWIICVQSYEIDGIEIPKGRMEYHTSSRPVVSKNLPCSHGMLSEYVNNKSNISTFKGFIWKLKKTA